MSEEFTFDDNLCEENEENDQPDEKQSTIVFKIVDYDLNEDERNFKFKNYDLILCEKCNQKFDRSSFCCKNCWKNETDDSKRKYMVHGKCEECFQINTHFNWCLSCNSKHFQQDFDKWTSGNKDIDKFIQETQLLAALSCDLLEWIPYNRLNDIKYIAEGGFSKVYSATWMDGSIRKWDQKSNNWKRDEEDKPLKVALKVFNNLSKNLSEDFINEIKFFKKANNYVTLIRCYGITQESSTQNYALLLQFMENGSLRSYLNQNFDSITWKQKLNIIYSTSTGLYHVHRLDSTHNDLHLGNVLQSFAESTITKTYTTYLSDFGFYKAANENSDNKSIYGVMPYMAPEVLRGKKYTQKSDVYSLGIIINEIISIIPPFNKEPHDYHLALDICHGKRPKIREETPQVLKVLIEKCWNANPENRPTSSEVKKILDGYIYDGISRKNYTKQVEELEELSYDFTDPMQFKTHAQAIYTSRLLNFSNLPEPVNCPNQEEFISSKYIMQKQTEETNIFHSECLDCSITDKLNINNEDEKNSKTPS